MTLSAQHNISLPSNTAYLHGNEVTVANGDKIGIEEFAIHKDHHNQLWVVWLLEILITHHSQQLHGILIQAYTVISIAQPYLMPRLQPTTKLIAPEVSNTWPNNTWNLISHPLQTLLCAVNIQHNCASNQCDGSGSWPAFIEHKQVPESQPAVQHYNPHDILLNTAKMRNAAWIQHFALNLPSVNATELDEAIKNACCKELRSWAFTGICDSVSQPSQ